MLNLYLKPVLYCSFFGMELSWPRSAFIVHLQMPSESGDELNLTVNNPYCDLTLEAMSLMKQLNVGARTCSGSVPLQTESLKQYPGPGTIAIQQRQPSSSYARYDSNQ